jgi:hypothetical protein
MAIGKIERWPDYLATAQFGENSGVSIDQSEVDSLNNLMPPVYFHIDPESFNVDYGYQWNTSGKGPKRFVPPDEGEPAEPGGLALPLVQKASTGLKIKGLALRFDDLTQPAGVGISLTTEKSLKALHNMALPFDDPRSVLRITRHYEVKTSIVNVFFLKEGKLVVEPYGRYFKDKTVPAGVIVANPPRRDPENGKILDEGRVRYWVEQVQKFENTGPRTLTSTEKSIDRVDGKLAPHPLILNLGWPMSNFVCVITKFDHNITRVAADGTITAATAILDLEQYNRQTLQQVNAISAEESDVDTPSRTIKDLWFVRGERSSSDQRRIDIKERPVTFVTLSNSSEIRAASIGQP